MTQLKCNAGQSAVAAAAYRAGEKLYCDYYGKTYDYTRKHGVVHKEILLPENAPEAYRDRATLWNAVEVVEKNNRAQLAYNFDIALQNELTMEENIELARVFVQREFVDRGMIADLCVHMPEGDGRKRRIFRGSHLSGSAAAGPSASGGGIACCCGKRSPAGT